MNTGYNLSITLSYYNLDKEDETPQELNNTVICLAAGFDFEEIKKIIGQLSLPNSTKNFLLEKALDHERKSVSQPQ